MEPSIEGFHYFDPKPLIKNTYRMVSILNTMIWVMLFGREPMPLRIYWTGYSLSSEINTKALSHVIE